MFWRTPQGLRQDYCPYPWGSWSASWAWGCHSWSCTPWRPRPRSEAGHALGDTRVSSPDLYIVCCGLRSVPVPGLARCSCLLMLLLRSAVCPHNSVRLNSCTETYASWSQIDCLPNITNKNQSILMQCITDHCFGKFSINENIWQIWAFGRTQHGTPTKDWCRVEKGATNDASSVKHCICTICSRNSQIIPKQISFAVKSKWP